MLTTKTNRPTCVSAQADQCFIARYLNAKAVLFAESIKSVLQCTCMKIMLLKEASNIHHQNLTRCVCEAVMCPPPPPPHTACSPHPATGTYLYVTRNADI